LGDKRVYKRSVGAVKIKSRTKAERGKSTHTQTGTTLVVKVKKKTGESQKRSHKNLKEGKGSEQPSNTYRELDTGPKTMV